MMMNRSVFIERTDSEDGSAFFTVLCFQGEELIWAEEFDYLNEAEYFASDYIEQMSKWKITEYPSLMVH